MLDFQVAQVTNLGPIFVIVLDVIIFGSREQMLAGFYAGATISLRLKAGLNRLGA